MPVALLVFVGAATLMAVAQAGFFPDDAYITFRYARNLASGQGLVYNAGERHLGTSGPGYALLLGALGTIFGGARIPIAADVIAWGSLVAGAAGLYALFGGRGWKPLGLVAGLLYITMPLVRGAYGFEVLPQLACVIWAFHFYFKSLEQLNPAWYAALLLGAATWLRPDALLFAAPLLIHYWCQRVRQSELQPRHWIRALPWRETVLALSMILAGMFALRVYYGVWMPTTFAAKKAQYLSSWDPFFIGVWKWLGDSYLKRLTPTAATAILALFGLSWVSYAVKVDRLKPLPVLLSACLLHTAFYSATLPCYTWYYAPEGLMLAVLGGLAAHYLLNALSAQRNLGYAAWAAVGVLAFWHSRLEFKAAQEFSQLAGEATKVQTYRGLGRWLKQNTLATESVGLAEVGVVGWESERPITDQFFLVVPGDADSVRRKAFDTAFKSRRPTIIAESPQLFGSMQGHLWFQRDYEYWTSFPSGNKRPLTAAEGRKLQRMDKLEIDLWRRRKQPIPSEQAGENAKRYIRLLESGG